MRWTTIIALTMLTAALVVNCSKFAVGGSQASAVLTVAQLAPVAVDQDDDLSMSLRRKAKAAMDELEARRAL